MQLTPGRKISLAFFHASSHKIDCPKGFLISTWSVKGSSGKWKKKKVASKTQEKKI